MLATLISDRAAKTNARTAASSLTRSGVLRSRAARNITSEPCPTGHVKLPVKEPQELQQGRLKCVQLIARYQAQMGKLQERVGFPWRLNVTSPQLFTDVYGTGGSQRELFADFYGAALEKRLHVCEAVAQIYAEQPLTSLSVCNLA